MSNKPTASISKLTFSGGNTFELAQKEKIILVGPNNSGKSQTLRDILSISGDKKDFDTSVVTDLEFKKEGTAEQLNNFLSLNADLVSGYYSYKNIQIHKGHIDFWNGEYLGGNLLNAYIKNIDANSRLLICEQQNSIAPNDQKVRPQHVLYDDSNLMDKISTLFERAFGKKLMFNFRGGSRLPIHVGLLPDSNNIVDRVSNEYVAALQKLPLLDKQGDGMKSYAGILFESIVTNYDITLIDEPEAFLHPPQMRKLAETLAKEVDGQLFVSTHSSDILRGFLEGTQGNVRILRISRDNNKNIVMEADEDSIKTLWTRPELRYSNALEGIFHEQTIICEDDSDCRLINSIADYLSLNSSEQWLDTAYVPTGGKHGIPIIADILRKMGVPVKAVFDIDFLSEKSLVEKTVVAFGGIWEEFESLWNQLNSTVTNQVTTKDISQIKKEIIGLLSDPDNSGLPKKDVNEAMKQNTAWNMVKKYGEAAIPSGNIRTVYMNLIKKLEEIGIYTIPVGEIESFCPEIAGHGPKFVNNLLTEVSLDDDRLNDLRFFVEKVHLGTNCNLL